MWPSAYFQYWCLECDDEASMTIWISQLEFLGRFKKILKKLFSPLNLSLQEQERERVYITTTKSMCSFLLQEQERERVYITTTKSMCSFLLQLNHIQIHFRYWYHLALLISNIAIDNAHRYRYRWRYRYSLVTSTWPSSRNDSVLSVSSALLFWGTVNL